MANTSDRAIRVLVVDDSAFMRKVISDILNSDNEINVIDTARNGQEAISKAESLKPDVITLDIEMPVMDGLKCLEELIKINYVPVVMLSSLTGEGTDATIRALEIGAVDFIAKPANIFNITGDEKRNEIIAKVKIARNSTRVRKFSDESLREKPVRNVEKSCNIKYIVAIGTSTGGPKALQEVIPNIPGNVPAAFLVVQHMPPGFTKSLASRLNSMSELTVKEAEDGDIIKPGYVYIAPGDYHMLVEMCNDSGLKIRLSQEPPVGGHRPAVDTMMESLSATKLKNIIGVIMTGMGGDGSEGIKKIKSVNEGYLIAQDEKTCVVYGMPRVAVQTGMVDAVVSLNNIAQEIMKKVGV